eukprot:TRINITY_DN4048_c0_g1_i3.p1 TRINITY_DN4048_c0_g1~~TRINITY_DN4048_c0_g1_i3.p1  ORF type:complete len:539 (+),score=148.57 TRINITY_DN4048_c0_g1_i3:1-1617(+)
MKSAKKPSPSSLPLPLGTMRILSRQGVSFMLVVVLTCFLVLSKMRSWVHQGTNDTTWEIAMISLVLLSLANYYSHTRDLISEENSNSMTLIFLVLISLGTLYMEAMENDLGIIETINFSWFRGCFPIIMVVFAPRKTGIILNILVFALLCYGAHRLQYCNRALAVVFDYALINIIVYLQHLFAHQSHTQLTEAISTAEKANETKTVFMAKMSHDLRTPLNGVIGFLDELIRTKLNSEQKEIITTIRVCATSLERLIVDLLDVSMIEVGRIGLNLETFNLKERMTSISMIGKNLAGKVGKNFNFQVDSQLPMNVVGDPARIQQILINLITNAIKFTPVEGLIACHVTCLQLEKDDELMMYFEVADSGIGIPPESTKRVFDQFYQCRKEDAPRGSGLGLYICAQLINIMGGKIACDSKIGVGSKFHGNIPLKLNSSWVHVENPFNSQMTQELEDSRMDISENENSQETPTPPTRVPRNPDPTDLFNMKVLVAEDNPVNMKLVTRFLNRLGVSHVTAVNGQEAIDIYLDQYKYGIFKLNSI